MADKKQEYGIEGLIEASEDVIALIRRFMRTIRNSRRDIERVLPAYVRLAAAQLVSAGRLAELSAGAGIDADTLVEFSRNQRDLSGEQFAALARFLAADD